MKASGRVPTHPRLVCVHRDEWTEAHWDAEAKTYALGARFPQLDKYNTKGSDVQVLIDKELEKTSKEDSASKAESEEDLKEPGPLIDQQIHPTPITQSLKASPTDMEQPDNPFLTPEAPISH